LIQMGAIGVDFDGIVVQDKQNIDHATDLMVDSLSAEDNNDIDKVILNVFNGKPLSVKDILDKTKLDWTSRRLTAYLQRMESIQIIKKGKLNQYVFKGCQIEQASLFH